MLPRDATDASSSPPPEAAPRTEAAAQMSEQSAPLWKALVIGAVALLFLAGLFVVLFNLPIVTGSVPA